MCVLSAPLALPTLLLPLPSSVCSVVILRTAQEIGCLQIKFREKHGLNSILKTIAIFYLPGKIHSNILLGLEIL